MDYGYYKMKMAIQNGCLLLISSYIKNITITLWLLRKWQTLNNYQVPELLQATFWLKGPVI